MLKDNEQPVWGKCKVIIDDEIEIDQIQDGTTTLNPEQGEKHELTVEGGETLRTRYQKNKYTLEFVEIGNSTMQHLDGTVAGNHKIKLISCDDGVDREVFTIPSVVINIQERFGTGDGTLSTYTCAVNRQKNGKSIEWAETTSAPSINISNGKAILTAESGATIYYTLDGSIPTTDSTRYSAPINLTDSCNIHAIAVENDVMSAVTCRTYTKPNV